MLSDTVGEQVTVWRKRRKWSRQRLAEECAMHGMPDLTPASLTNIESGRRQHGVRRRTVSVDELAVIANALGVPPVMLVAPILERQYVELFPDGAAVPTVAALEWFSGMGTLVGDRDSADELFRQDATHAIRLLRAHGCLVAMRMECAREMRSCIEEMANAGEIERASLIKRQDSLLCRLEGFDYDIRTLRDHLRSRQYPIPPLPGDLVHLDSAPRNWEDSVISHSDFPTSSDGKGDM